MKRSALALALSLAACANGRGPLAAFSLSATPSSAAEVNALAARVRSAQRPVEPAVVVLAPAAPAQGFTVYDLNTGARRAQVGARLDSRVMVAGETVLARSGGSLVAWDLNGQERWRVPDAGMELNGASSDGETLAVTLGGAGVTRRRGLLLVLDARSGAVRVRRSVDHALGVPAVAGAEVLVPWDGQNLSVFNVASDEETLRVRTRDDVVGWARREGPTVYFGSRALYRLDERAAAGRGESMTRWAPPRDDLPGAAGFAPDGYTARRPGLDARDRVRTLWRADGDAPDGQVRFDGDALYALFHRVVFALAPDTGAVRWARVLPSDVIGGEAVRRGLVTVDEQGRVSLLSAADGRPLWRGEAGNGGVQADVQAPADFAPAANESEPAQPLVDALLEAASGSDARLLPAQVFAAKALGAVEGPAATRALVTLLSRRALSPELRAAAGEALSRRTTGADAMLEALQQHYDYVRNAEAPPVGILARALAAAGERRAVPLLVSHLFDPATPVTDLAPITAALRQLADPSALPALVDFVQLYHADIGGVPASEGGDAVDDRDLGDQQHLDAAMETAIDAIARMGGPDEQRVLDAIAEHPSTPASVAAAARRARVGQQPGDAGDGGSEADASEMTFAMPPARLDMAAIEEAVAPHRAELLECLRGAPSRPAQLRIQFRYDNEGRVSHVSVMPRSFEACVAPRFEAIQLPASGSAREIGTYILDTLH